MNEGDKLPGLRAPERTDMTDHKVEYRGIEVPEDFLQAGSLLGGNIAALKAWKRGVDAALDAVAEPVDKTEYFHAPGCHGSLYAIRPDETVEYYAASIRQVWKSTLFETPEWVRAQRMEPAAATDVPADFRLEPTK